MNSATRSIPGVEVKEKLRAKMRKFQIYDKSIKIPYFFPLSRHDATPAIAISSSISRFFKLKADVILPNAVNISVSSTGKIRFIDRTLGVKCFKERLLLAKQTDKKQKLLSAAANLTALINFLNLLKTLTQASRKIGDSCCSCSIAEIAGTTGVAALKRL